MNPELHRRLLLQTNDLIAHPDNHRASTQRTYTEKLHAQWKPYAEANDLPTEFSAEDTRALTPDELVAFIVACKLGRTRRHTRDGQRQATRLGSPLATSTLDGILAALRNSHKRAGFPWAGDNSRVKEVRRGYATTSTANPIRATPLTRDHLHHLFAHTPTITPLTRATIHARARTAALALNLTLADLTTLDPRLVSVSRKSATVTLADTTARTTFCLLTQLDDPVAAAACAHCRLRAWLGNDPTIPFLPESELASTRQATRALVARLSRAGFARDRINVDNSDLWTTIALGLDCATAEWLRMRAALLPMFAVGLRLDDIDQLRVTDIAFHTSTITISIVGKTEHGHRPHTLTLTPEGGPLCPVGAMRHYDAWTRAYLQDRTKWMPGQRNGLYPAPLPTNDVTASRALYQATRIWLVGSGIKVDDLGAGTRQALSPHSARRGFAQQAQADGARDDDISDALRHTRMDTTAAYLDNPGNSPADHLLTDIAKEAR